MNSFINLLKEQYNYATTENGATTHWTTFNKVYDMFAFGGAYRNRSDDDVILLFKEAFEQDKEMAIKCLFYLRDVRGGQGERRFFRVAYRWLAKNYPIYARQNMDKIPEFGRWDDLIEVTYGTYIEFDAFELIKRQLILDAQCKTPSLLAKWLPSENASSPHTKMLGYKIREFMELNHKEYRKLLSGLRTRINIVEKLMSENRWDEIEFDKIPSKAGLKYKNAFARREIIAKKYEAFAKDANTTVNAATLYPYEVVAKVVDKIESGWREYSLRITETDRAMINKYWQNLPDYFNGKSSNMMCVVDTSGSMTGPNAAAPINVAISLGMYCAERNEGPFKNYYISFSHEPRLVEIRGVDFVDKVARIYATNVCENTNLTAVFEMLLKIGMSGVKLPETLVVISDMEIDCMSYWSTPQDMITEMERIRNAYKANRIKMPKLIYWNVDARQNNILDLGPEVSFVSGMSPVIFKSVLTGKNGIDLMLEVLGSQRYKDICINE